MGCHRSNVPFSKGQTFSSDNQCITAAGRECDPDLCGGCAATCDGSAEGLRVCGNMRLRLAQHKRVAMGLSTVAGWGAFLHTPARRDQLLGEYTGELITQEEADRRCVILRVLGLRLQPPGRIVI